MFRTLLFLLLCSTLALADTTVVVKAVVMETGTTQHFTQGSYTWHSMIVEVDGTTYKIARTFRRHETWLHKGTYTGRWTSEKRDKLQVDIPDGDKIRHVDFDVLGEE